MSWVRIRRLSSFSSVSTGTIFASHFMPIPTLNASCSPMTPLLSTVWTFAPSRRPAMHPRALVLERARRPFLLGLVAEAERDDAFRRALALDVLQLAVEDLLAARDDADLVADLFCLLHAVRREQHRPPLV